MFCHNSIVGFGEWKYSGCFLFCIDRRFGGEKYFLKDIDITEIPTKAGKRYSRLLPVVVLATLFTFITMMLGLQCHLEISDEAVNTEFLAAYCNFRPTVISLFSHSFFWPFVDYSAYVGPFWTISYELWGYIIVFLMAMSLKNSKWRRFVYLVLIPAIYFGLDEYYCVFVLGLLVADLEFNQNPTIGNKWVHQPEEKQNIYTACFLPFCLFFLLPNERSFSVIFFLV